MSSRAFQRSFSGGEIGPDMYGQIADAKFQAGLAKCLNFVTKPQGPAENRAGFQFVRAVNDSTKQSRLIPFTFSTTQTMVIELGAGYFRFYTSGAALLAPNIADVDAWAGGVSYVVGDLVAESGTVYYCAVAHASGSGTFAADLALGRWYAEPSTGEYEIPNPYAEADLFEIDYVQSADVMTLTHVGYKIRELRRLGATKWTLAEEVFAAPIDAPFSVYVVQTGSGTEYSYDYVVTAVASDLVSESAVSVPKHIHGNLYTTGNYITISWNAVPGAALYNVYKMQGGVYGYIGQTSGNSIVDDNIAPDLSITPPIYETVFSSAGNYPGACSYFEQRRCFAGTLNAKQAFWATRAGTESTMSYSLPLRDDDRISVRVAAREANTIRHIVPLSELLLLTSAAEWRVTSLNSDAITPSTISIRPQSYVGAGPAQPVIVNTNMLYAAARGGHVRECAYNWQAGGFITGDLSLRAAHLFDGYDIVDMAYSKAPLPIVWFTSTSGKLLGLTYVPEQQIGAWHQHDTLHGTFESVCCVAEGAEDFLYVVVRRYINGSYVRYIERMASRAFSDQADAFFVDSGLTFDGTNTGSDTMTLSGGTTWGPGEVLTLTGSAAWTAFPATTDVGDAVVLTDSDGAKYTLTIASVSSTTVASVTTDKTLPVALRAAATTKWALARDTLSGLGHLEGETLNILADGAVHPQRTVSGGEISLDAPAVVVHAGLPITADAQTLPPVLQTDSAFGQGRPKNINKAWLRVYRSSGIWIGPDADHLTEAKQRTTEAYGSPPALKSEEIEMLLTPSWQDTGQVYVRQTDPLPLTLVALTLEIQTGG